ncbi:fungal-specific transcription factor domain-containing protein, partial [Mycena filopes]
MRRTRCPNCRTNAECTHTKGTPQLPTVDSVKAGQAHVTAVFSTSTIYIPSNDPDVSHQRLLDVCSYARSLEEKLASLTPRTDADLPFTLLSPGGPGDVSEPFYGPLSSVTLTRAAMQHIQWSIAPEAILEQYECNVRIYPWQKPTSHPSPQVFPEDDLLKDLVKIYFRQINPILDILHFPTFAHNIANGVHLRDLTFGAVVLAVCAVASRYSDDERVFLDGAEQSCGWKWFRQVQEPFSLMHSPEPSLHLLQLVLLSIAYLGGTASAEEMWNLSGLGIRLAHGAGLHQRSAYRRMHPLTAELCKRAFWSLVSVDLLVGAVTGRPNMMRPTDVDIEWPLDCEHEGWEGPNAVQVPSEKASIHAHLSVHVRLMMIYGRIQSNVSDGQMCSEDAVAELDSELNKWVDTIPEHLKWDPLQENQIFFDQSTALYAMYYFAQILIHRPFIRTPGEADVEKSRFPSLAICATAARACAHVLDVHARRGRGLLHLSFVVIALFDSAVLLLVNVWNVLGRTARTPTE